ncbi:hypothetical protein LZ30DRAFT_778475 [Colletotrichum cereale]|nr:hypothetical protein LZ30DRAFT_778475 [Colletotrichum cereale]
MPDNSAKPQQDPITGFQDADNSHPHDTPGNGFPDYDAYVESEESMEEDHSEELNDIEFDDIELDMDKVFDPTARRQRPTATTQDENPASDFQTRTSFRPKSLDNKLKSHQPGVGDTNRPRYNRKAKRTLAQIAANTDADPETNVGPAPISAKQRIAHADEALASVTGADMDLRAVLYRAAKLLGRPIDDLFLPVDNSQPEAACINYINQHVPKDKQPKSIDQPHPGKPDSTNPEDDGWIVVTDYTDAQW